MASHRKPSDVPEPWFSKKKANAKTKRQEKKVMTSIVVEDCSRVNVPEDNGKRSRRRANVEPMGVDAHYQRKSGKTMSTSAVDIFLRNPQTAMPDVEEQRRKREEDAIACGRTVQTVFTQAKQKCDFVPACIGFGKGEHFSNAQMVFTSAIDPSSKKYRNTPAWTEAYNEIELDVEDVTENATRGAQPSCQRPWKEPVEKEVQEALDTQNSMRSMDQQKAVDVQSGGEDDSPKKYVNDALRNRRRSCSPIQKNPSDRQRRREMERSESPRYGRPSHRRPLSQSLSRSPPRNWSRQSYTPDRRSPRRSYSRSPVRQRRNEHRRRRHGFRDEEEEQRFMRYSNRECSHRGGLQSPSPDERIVHWRSQSPERGYRSRRSYTPLSSRSPPRRARNDEVTRGKEWTDSTVVQGRPLLRMSPPLGRSQRRRRQASRESEKSQRQRVGQKPFYLTLDGEGKPYGSGKPAWIAEINKLAAGLDPSCTHVRKQTFEDVQTFKERLDEKFDYSRTLNEDHLRGLMGKAVTKRRGELIAFIKNDGKRPSHIDHEVWRRLEKLAFSKQWVEKSEQGRHANACRKTFGRTGSMGENGVREKLRSMLRRSPDPDEVEEEMHREKGFGGRKRKIRTVAMEENKNCSEVVISNEDFHSTAHVEIPNGLSIHAFDGQIKRRQVIVEGGDNVEGGDRGVDEDDVYTMMTGNARRIDVDHETNRMSKDEYIRKLEAQIERFQGTSGGVPILDC